MPKCEQKKLKSKYFLLGAKFFQQPLAKDQSGFAILGAIIIALASLAVILSLNENAPSTKFRAEISQKQESNRDIQRVNDAALAVVNNLISDPEREKCAIDPYTKELGSRTHSLNCPIFHGNLRHNATDWYQFVDDPSLVTFPDNPYWRYTQDGANQPGISANYKVRRIKRFFVKVPQFFSKLMSSDLNLIYSSFGDPAPIESEIFFEGTVRDGADTTFRFRAQTDYKGKRYTKTMRLMAHVGRAVGRAFVTKDFTPKIGWQCMNPYSAPNPDTTPGFKIGMVRKCHAPEYPVEFAVVRAKLFARYPNFENYPDEYATPIVGNEHCHYLQQNRRSFCQDHDGESQFTCNLNGWSWVSEFKNWYCDYSTREWDEWADGYEPANIRVEVMDQFHRVEASGYGLTANGNGETWMPYYPPGQILVDRPTIIDIPIAAKVKRPRCHAFAQYLIKIQPDQKFSVAKDYNVKHPGVNSQTVFVHWLGTSTLSPWGDSRSGILPRYFGVSNIYQSALLERMVFDGIDVRLGSCEDISVGANLGNEDLDIPVAITRDMNNGFSGIMPPFLSTQKECKKIREDGAGLIYYPMGIAAEGNKEPFTSTPYSWYLNYYNSVFWSGNPGLGNMNCCYMVRKVSERTDMTNYFECRSPVGLNAPDYLNGGPSGKPNLGVYIH